MELAFIVRDQEDSGSNPLAPTKGAIAKGVGKLDRNTVAWRKLYFLRNSTKTLAEIRSAIETLRQLTTFQELLAKQSKGTDKKIESFCSMMTSTHSLVKELRNAVGGHILQKNVEDAIDSQEFDWMGILEMGEPTENLHYKFAGELVLAILLPNVPASEREAKIIEILKTAMELTAALGVIDLIFWMYLKEKGVV
jgi:hypothetical protein